MFIKNSISSIFKLGQTNHTLTSKKEAFSQSIACALACIGVESERNAIARYRELPDELMVHIFSFLPAEDLRQCLRVNHQWSQCAQTDTLWKNLCQNRGIPLPKTFTSGPEAYYRFQKKYKCKQSRNKDFDSFVIEKKEMPQSDINWRQNLFGYSSSSKKSLKLWDLESDECLFTIPEYLLHFDFDSESVVAAREEKSVVFREWKIDAAGQSMSTEQKTKISRLDTFTLCGDQVFVVDNTAILQLARETMEQTHSFSHPKPISKIANSNRLLASYGEGQLVVWDKESSQKLYERTFENKKNGISGVYLDEGIMMTTHPDCIKVWDLRNPDDPFFTWQPTCFYFCCALKQGIFALAEGDRVSTISSTDYTTCGVGLWNTQSSQLLNTPLKGTCINLPWGLRWSDSSLILLHANGQKRIWNID